MISFKAPKIEIIAMNEHSKIQFKSLPKKQINSNNLVEIKALNEHPIISFKKGQIKQTSIKQTDQIFKIKSLNDSPIIQFTQFPFENENKYKSRIIQRPIAQKNKIFEIKALNENPTICFKKPSKKQNICDNKISIEINYNQKTDDVNNEKHNLDKYLSKLEFFIKDEIMTKIINPYNKHKYDKVKKYIISTSFKKHLEFFEKQKYKSDAILYLINQISLLIREGIDNNEEIIELNDLVIELNKKIINLEKQVDKKKTYDSNIKTDLNVKVTLKDKYFIYITKFGLPKNGIFDQKKLEEC